MFFKAALKPRKDSRTNWNTWIVICGTAILIAVLITLVLLGSAEVKKMHPWRAAAQLGPTSLTVQT
jgi:uncharacterized membrane protein YeiB